MEWQTTSNDKRIDLVLDNATAFSSLARCILFFAILAVSPYVLLVALNFHHPMHDAVVGGMVVVKVFVVAREMAE